MSKIEHNGLEVAQSLGMATSAIIVDRVEFSVCFTQACQRLPPRREQKGPGMTQDRRYRIFVVDDEDVIATTLEMILSQQGFDVWSFTLPMKALASARELAPDLLISDVVMPGLSGIGWQSKYARIAQVAKCFCFPVKPPLPIC